MTEDQGAGRSAGSDTGTGAAGARIRQTLVDIPKSLYPAGCPPGFSGARAAAAALPHSPPEHEYPRY